MFEGNGDWEDRESSTNTFCKHSKLKSTWMLLTVFFFFFCSLFRFEGMVAAMEAMGFQKSEQEAVLRATAAV